MIFKKNKIKAASGDAFKYRMRDGFTYHSQNKAKEGQIVFFGDSITEMLSASDWYSDYSLESGLELYNRGIGGDTVIGLYKRVKESVTSINPKAVVILIGTNDLYFGFCSEFVVHMIDELVGLIKKECPECKIILQAIYPVIEKMTKNRYNKTIRETNVGYKAVAEKHGIIYLDMTDILVDASGNLKEEYTYDGLHLSAKGYEVTTREIVKLLP